MTITFHPNGTIESGGVSTPINKPAWMITGGANMYNNAESVVFDGDVFLPPSSFVNLDTHSACLFRYLCFLLVQFLQVCYLKICSLDMVVKITFGQNQSNF